VTGLDTIHDDDPTRAPALTGTVADEWASFARSLARRGRSPQTVGAYHKSYVKFWTWAAAEGLDPDPAKITRAHVNAWTDSLLRTPAVRNGRPVVSLDPTTGDEVPQMLAPATRSILWRNLRPFFTWYAKETDSPNPFTNADPPGGDKPAPVPVVPLDDIRKILATCASREFTDLRDAALIRVLIDCGARRGEVVAMTTDSWDRQAGMLIFTGKTGTRAVPASLSTAEAIDRYLRMRGKQRHAELPAFWLGTRGRLGETGIAQALKHRCELAGVEPINPHRFRHTWAHEFRAAGGGEGDLMHLAGWSSTAMAHRYGGSAAAGRAQDAARRIALGDHL
jgi:integrase